MYRVRHTTPEVEQRARELRQEATPAEQILWDALRAGRLDGHKFRRQHPVGRFILDFYCAKSRLCIELDGEVHEQQRDRDVARDATLFAHGVVTAALHQRAGAPRSGWRTEYHPRHGQPSRLATRGRGVA